MTNPTLFRNLVLHGENSQNLINKNRDLRTISTRSALRPETND
jgi:hypothetical protein